MTDLPYTKLVAELRFQVHILSTILMLPSIHEVLSIWKALWKGLCEETDGGLGDWVKKIKRSRSTNQQLQNSHGYVTTA